MWIKSDVESDRTFVIDQSATPLSDAILNDSQHSGAVNDPCHQEELDRLGQADLDRGRRVVKMMIWYVPIGFVS